MTASRFSGLWIVGSVVFGVLWARTPTVVFFPSSHDAQAPAKRCTKGKRVLCHCLYLAVYKRRFQAAPRGGVRLDLCGPKYRVLNI